MIWHKKLTSKRLFAFDLYFKRARILLACAMMFLVGNQTSFAGTSQIDSANKLVTQMMVEVETILAKDLNDDKANANNRLDVSFLCQIILWTHQKMRQIGHQWRLVPDLCCADHEAHLPAFGNRATVCVHNYLVNYILCH